MDSLKYNVVNNAHYKATAKQDHYKRHTIIVYIITLFM